MKKYLRTLGVIPLFLLSAYHCVFSGTCVIDSTVQQTRSEELQRLVQEDQAERETMDRSSEEAWENLSNHDLVRRMRVGEIFGEGCFQVAADYAAAALVFQHGDKPYHYYQAFLWSKQAVELGDTTQGSMMAVAIDRYLISIGKKQLFGTQFMNYSLSNPCYCIEPIEESFPDSLRIKYGRFDKAMLYEQLAQMNEGRCPSLPCNHDFENVPQGSIVGFW